MEELELIAYQTGGTPMTIVPMTQKRDWMDASPIANRCLPLLIANQAGWAILNPVGFWACWNGDPGQNGVAITPDGPGVCVASHFGEGIVTWSVHYLFRTPPGWNLLTRGPANYPKDGAVSLEGIVETDWSVATFTHNWKLTRTCHAVRWEAGEPFCCILPQRRGELESWRPRVTSMDAEPQLPERYQAWSRSRDAFNADPNRGPKDWQRHYFRGTSPGRAPEQVTSGHQTVLHLRVFE